jgi:hypothetical protein
MRASASAVGNLWRESTGYSDDTTARAEIATLDAKIANIRRAIEDGLANASWANARLGELIGQREPLAAKLDAAKPPQLDVKTVMLTVAKPRN